MLADILAQLTQPNAPEALERLYRSDRAGFAWALSEALAARPDSELLRAWTARLAADAAEAADRAAPGVSWASPGTGMSVAAGHHSPTARREIWLVVVLALLAGLFIKLPGIFPDSSLTFFREDWFYPRNIVPGPLGALFLYLLYARGWKHPGSWLALGLFAVPALWLNFLSDTRADATLLACLHGPLLLWCLLSAAWAGGGWPDVEQRRTYIRFFGELLVFSVLLLLGGGVLLLLTQGLFELLNVPTRWIWEWMLPMGGAAIPVVAGWAVLRHGGGMRIMPLLARIFAPLFLVLTMGYLVRMAAHVSELFRDRDTLLVYNLLLLAVLGLAVFSLSGRSGGDDRDTDARSGLVEWLLAFLLVLTVLLDFVGLAAIGDRLLEMGATPNRLAVLGSNLAVLGNLLALLLGYARLLRRRAVPADLERITARYLPVYALWTAGVAFVFPLLWG
ncbi:MAG: hypothetical protein AB7E32_01595 [Desulfovibrio sp.]